MASTIAHSATHNAATRVSAQRIVNLIGGAVTALALLSIAWLALDMLVLDGRDGRKFEHIAMNTTRQEVESAMGRPDDWNVCGKYLWRGGEYRGTNDGRCVTQVRYEHMLST